MAKILQFPSREVLQREEQIEMLNRHLDLCEEDISMRTRCPFLLRENSYPDIRFVSSGTEALVTR